MHRKFGYHRMPVWSENLIMPGIEGKQNMARMLDRLRKSPPAAIGTETVTERLDLWDRTGAWLGRVCG